MNSGKVSQAIDFENFKIDRIESLNRWGDQERSAGSCVEKMIRFVPMTKRFADDDKDRHETLRSHRT